MIKKPPFKHAPCPTCQGKVVGRRDKRFCSLKCKNEHHRVARQMLKSRFDELQNRLYRNLVVLEGTLGTKHNSMSIHQNTLFKIGFDLKANTGSYRKKNKTYFEVENYTYSFENNGNILVRRNHELSSFMPVFFRRWLIDFPAELEVGKSDINLVREKIENFARWNE